MIFSHPVHSLYKLGYDKMGFGTKGKWNRSNDRVKKAKSENTHWVHTRSVSPNMR